MDLTRDLPLLCATAPAIQRVCMAGLPKKRVIGALSLGVGVRHDLSPFCFGGDSPTVCRSCLHGPDHISLLFCLL